jgi:hypothetical protein
MIRNSKSLLYLSIALLVIGTVQPVSAHLMVAQSGTLNITGKGIYMVLSLPATAFLKADDNADRQLQTSELLAHRLRVVDAIKNEILIFCDKERFGIEGLMLTPVEKFDTDHTHSVEATDEISGNSGSVVVDQIVVMGRYPVMCSDGKSLTFQAGLFGAGINEQMFSMTAKTAQSSKRQTFEVTPETRRVKIRTTDP